jgi:hypothetical protein
MATNITYLLGAGASANCLPVINELPGRLVEFKSLLEVRHDINSTEFRQWRDNGLAQVSKQLIDDIDYTLKELGKHSTIDTLARRYFLTNNPRLKVLKQVLITYFLFEQTYHSGSIRTENRNGTYVEHMKQTPDKRYDSFIATILQKHNDNLSFPDNFKIITWNYDTQFEYASSEYLINQSLTDVQKAIQAIPTLEDINSEGTREIDLSKFCIVRLNGVAHIKSDLSKFVWEDVRHNTAFLDAIDKRETKYLSEIVSFYTSISGQTEDIFKYAWETQDILCDVGGEHKNVTQLASSIMQQTNVLVLIGYSFPLFNRAVDKQLFDSFEQLSKVYIQDLRGEDILGIMRSSFSILGKKVKENKNRYRLSGMFEDEVQKKPGEYIIDIEVISDVNQFFIPPEADI